MHQESKSDFIVFDDGTRSKITIINFEALDIANKLKFDQALSYMCQDHFDINLLSQAQIRQIIKVLIKNTEKTTSQLLGFVKKIHSHLTCDESEKASTSISTKTITESLHLLDTFGKLYIASISKYNPGKYPAYYACVSNIINTLISLINNKLVSAKQLVSLSRIIEKIETVPEQFKLISIPKEATTASIVKTCCKSLKEFISLNLENLSIIQSSISSHKDEIVNHICINLDAITILYKIPNVKDAVLNNLPGILNKISESQPKGKRFLSIEQSIELKFYYFCSKNELAPDMDSIMGRIIDSYTDISEIKIPPRQPNILTVSC